MTIGEFSIAESVIGEIVASASASVLGPSFQFAAEDVKFRYGERYISDAANKKFLGIPRGVYLGFIPSFGTDNILTLAPDSNYGVSFARVTSQDDPLYSVDVFIQTDVVLDFSNHNSFPVNVVLKANGTLGFPHSAEILTQSASPTQPTEILLGVVTAPQTISVAEPFSRDTPYAYTGAPLNYGFMKSGAVEELLAAIALNAEITAARVDLTGTTQATLGTRLDADGDPSTMADRLGKETQSILAGDFVVGAPSAAINISRGFAAIHRTAAGLAPFEDIEGFASETRPGAVTSGVVPDPAPIGALTDNERNVCAIIDATTQARITGTSREVIFGRLSLSEITLSGTEIVFTNASPTVTGTGTLFTTEVEAGDIIQDPVGGGFYEVATTPVSDVSLTLSVVFAGTTTPPATAPALRRRFELNGRTRTGAATDSPFSIPIGTVRVFFTSWQKIDASRFDYLPLLARGFEESPVPLATTSLEGKALMAATLSDARAGSVFAVQQSGGQVGPSHVYNVDFNGATLSGPGIADVTQRGPTGLPGNPGSGGIPGPTGIQGPTGVGFSNFATANLFRESALFSHATLGSGAQYSFSTTMSGSEILFLTGGNSEWYSPFVFDADDHWQIDDILIVSGLNVRLDARVPTGSTPAAEVRFFLNAATR